MTSQKALERRLVALMERAERTFLHDGTAVIPSVIAKAVDDVWCALRRDRDFARAERLLAVIGLLVRRESMRFKSDPRKYAERQRELAA